MSAAAIAVVLFVFFLVGVLTGVLAVIALSVRRAGRAVRARRVPATRRPTWPPMEIEDDYPDDTPPDEPGWWQARGDE